MHVNEMVKYKNTICGEKQYILQEYAIFDNLMFSYKTEFNSFSVFCCILLVCCRCC